MVNCQASQVIMVQPCLPMLPKTILQRTVDSSRRRGRLQKSWKDNIKEWTGLSISSVLCIADDRGRWSTITERHLSEFPNDAKGIMGIRL